MNEPMWMYLLIAMNVAILAMLVRSLRDNRYKPEENEYKYAVKRLFKSSANIDNTENEPGL